MKHDEAVRLAATMMATPEGTGETAWLIDQLARSPDARDRSMFALRLGFLPGEEARAALVRCLDDDPDPSVRFMAAQGLVVGRGDTACFAAIARLIGDMVAIGTRDALDTALHATGVVAIHTDQARKGFGPRPSPEQIAPVRAAALDALALAERLRSRHRRPLAGWLAVIDGTPEPPGFRAPDGWAALEALIPTDLIEPTATVRARSGADWWDLRLRRALRPLGVRPRDTTVVAVESPHGTHAPGITLYVVPGVTERDLLSAFEPVIPRPGRAPWGRRVIGDRDVRWSTSEAWTAALYARDGMVVQVAGSEESVAHAVGRLP